MVQQATDVPTSEIGQTAVAVLVVEQRLAVLPQRLMAVHARTVVLEQRLRHEGRGVTGFPCHVLDHVLEQLHFVSSVLQGVELVVDLHLATGAHLMVCAFNLQTNVFKCQ